MRPIDADALKQAINGTCSIKFFSLSNAMDIIDAMPTITAPVRHGRWEVVDAEEPRRYGCSLCKRLSWHMENYCPNCGARMDGEEE